MPSIPFPRDKSGQQQTDAALLGLVVIGAALRLWQFSANTSLWLDEIFLASNILHRSIWQLLTVPLDYGQVAPIGFLLSEKLLSVSLGPSDFVLKLFPMLCSLAGLVGFAVVARRLLDGLAAPVALALFATARPLVVFAAQVKQYSSDVAIAVLLLWVATELVGKISLRRSLLAGAVGAISVWFSQPAMLMVAALGVSIALIASYEPPESGGRNLLALVPALGLWGISALCAGVVSIAFMGAHTRDFMHQYWAEGFLPTPAWRAIELHWPWGELRALIGPGGLASLGYPISRLYILMMGFGVFILWRRLGSRVLLLVMPIAVTLSAAILRQYPFSDRLILFLVPSFFLAIAASIGWICQQASSWSRPVGWFLCIALIGPAVYPVAAFPPPYRVEDMKPVMAHVAGNWQAGDRIYVFHGANSAFGFYRGDYGFRDGAYELGRCHHDENVAYRLELDAYRGQPRVWVIMTHALPYYHERDDIVSYLDAIGVRRDDLAVPARIPGQPFAEVFLYDLSDPARLRSATATSLALVGPISGDARFSCANDPPLVIPPRQN
jgi:hypothetical protein